MRTSANTAPLFVTTPPDWLEKVKMELVYNTALYTSRSGKEQRARGRFSGKPRQTYQSTALTKEEWEARLPQIREEMRSALVVPFWSEGLRGTRTGRPVFRRCGTGTVRACAPVARRRKCGRYIFEMTAATRPEWFTAGDWVYVWDGTAGQFRQLVRAAEIGDGIRRASWYHLRLAAPDTYRITSHGGHFLILTPPPSGEDTLGDNVTIYPCKLSRRISAQEEGRRRSQHSYNETLIYEAL